MRYLPHTAEDIEKMLRVIGAGSIDDLFSTVPTDSRMDGPLHLPPPLNEWALNDHMDSLASRQATGPRANIFLGAGRYEHHIPAVVTNLASRSEFVTSYTPYQPEISQGTLQAIYEYQTLISRLLGMDVTTASHYDGSTALAESLLMAVRVTKRTKVAVSRLIHPLYRSVVKTYLTPTGCEVVDLPYKDDGTTDLGPLDGLDGLAGVAVQSPNFFGCIEDLDSTAAVSHDLGALFAAAFTEPMAYGLIKNPGSQGADIACGEGQSFGIPMNFGGPGLGILAGRAKFMRSLPGRLVGKTTDIEGRRGFVLTLATREQHIRREKATSNICTNNSLCALTAAVYLACLGSTGMRELALLNRDKAEYLKAALVEAGCTIPFTAHTFNEFVVKFPAGFDEKLPALLEKGTVPGLALDDYYPELSGHHLVCVTETKTRSRMDELVKEVAS
ncbi:MAG TPA: aminomethyl-transferring glycine dehydrogenase subunit GcvPA [Desulfobacteraceae bacterium]|jgi:glycine dehydrogenase subunit 1|nr:aminomethyl-transferring glycine dehydrogenase subunit GcvPA [Desulfobacteraceae bacterium]